MSGGISSCTKLVLILELVFKVTYLLFLSEYACAVNQPDCATILSLFRVGRKILILLLSNGEISLDKYYKTRYRGKIFFYFVLILAGKP